MIKYSFENAERPKIRRPKYSQNLLDCRPNDARYAFLRPGQIQLANFRAAGRIKDIAKESKERAAEELKMADGDSVTVACDGGGFLARMG